MSFRYLTPSLAPISFGNLRNSGGVTEQEHYHVTLSLNVISQHFDILAEPPIGPLHVVSSHSRLGYFKASGHEKSLATTAFL